MNEKAKGQRLLEQSTVTMHTIFITSSFYHAKPQNRGDTDPKTLTPAEPLITRSNTRVPTANKNAPYAKPPGRNHASMADMPCTTHSERQWNPSSNVNPGSSRSYAGRLGPQGICMLNLSSRTWQTVYNSSFNAFGKKRSGPMPLKPLK